MSFNTPDDWGNYYYTCDICGNRGHASEGDCCEVCVRCEESGIDDEEKGMCDACIEELEEEEQSNKKLPDLPLD